MSWQDWYDNLTPYDAPYYTEAEDIEDIDMEDDYDQG